jgi:hypothetical protein
MNVGRGLFRGWILLTVLWLIVIGWSVFDSIARGRWEYVEVVKDYPDINEIDWSRPFYETRKSPSAEKLSVSFYQREIDNVNFNEEVRTGNMVLRTMPDRSSLYVDARFTNDDQDYLAAAFWSQRWRRYASLVWDWVPLLVLPPLALLAFGWAILWVCRGFKTAPR